MAATSISCIKCGVDAVLVNREVEYGEEHIQYVGAVSVPRLEVLEIDCPHCGRFRYIRKYDEPFG